MADAIADPDQGHRWVRHPVTMAVMWGLLLLTLVSAAILGLGLLDPEQAFNFSSIVYVVVPVGSGLAVMAAALSRTARQRLAWIVIGAATLFWGIGELIWVIYEYVLGVEVPYPGWADVFYVLGYPMLFVGVMLLPQIKPNRLERVRLTLDALAGSIALAAVMWVLYLKDQIFLDPEVGFFEQAINVLYPAGDVILLIAVMILVMRRSPHRFDLRLLALGVSLVITAVADIIYLVQLEADSYVSGGRLDALWLLDYAAVIVAALYLLQRPRLREVVDRSTRVWQVVLPYVAVLTLFGFTFFDVRADTSLLEAASSIVVVLIIARQAVSIRENRALVERQRDELIASISHELRTPLTSVTGYTSLLEADWQGLSDEQRDSIVFTINRQATHVSWIVEDLVALANRTLVATDLSIETLDVAELGRCVGDMLPETNDDIDLRVEVAPDLFISGDRRRLTQVLVNLLTNAARYGGGEVLVRAAAARDGQVAIAVHDNGPGVPKRYEEVIWQRFERGAHRLDASTPGSGIGLSIARSLVDAHGGTIAYRRSELLGGACFSISIPTSREFRPEGEAERSDVLPVVAEG